MKLWRMVIALGLASTAAAAQTAPTPPPGLTRPPTMPQPTAPSAGQTRDPNRPNHWFYDMLDKSDAGRLTGKKTGRRPTQDR
jgi:hypothetical protein